MRAVNRAVARNRIALQLLFILYLNKKIFTKSEACFPQKSKNTQKITIHVQTWKISTLLVKNGKFFMWGCYPICVAVVFNNSTAVQDCGILWEINDNWLQISENFLKKSVHRVFWASFLRGYFQIFNVLVLLA